MQYKYLIIGGGVAGTSAAETIKNIDLDSSIAIVNNENYALYSKVMLSKTNYFSEKISPEKVFLKNTDWYQQKGISFLGGKVATKLDSAAKTVALSDGEILQYEKLLLLLIYSLSNRRIL